MSEGSNPRQLVVFTLGAEQYALPIQQVHEIIRYTEPRSVASRVSWVRGVISLRGRIVPVYDLNEADLFYAMRRVPGLTLLEAIDRYHREAAAKPGAADEGTSTTKVTVALAPGASKPVQLTSPLVGPLQPVRPLDNTEE